MRRPDKKANNYAFIDSQNLNLGTQKVGWKMDWGRFRRHLADQYAVSKAYMFIGYMPEYEAMYEQLHDLGYLIVLKPTVGALDEKKPDDTSPSARVSHLDAMQGDGEERSESYKEYGDRAPEPSTPQRAKSSAQISGSAAEQSDAVRKPAVKGNIDAELVLYAMKEIPNYDKAIIVSGDGDFYCLVEYLAEKNKLLHLMAPNWQYSSLLKPYEQYIIRLDKERRLLAYRGGKRPNK